MKFPIRFILRSWRFCCALGVSAAFCVILTKISNRSGNAVLWNGGITQYILKLTIIIFDNMVLLMKLSLKMNLKMIKLSKQRFLTCISGI